MAEAGETAERKAASFSVGIFKYNDRGCVFLRLHDADEKPFALMRMMPEEALAVGAELIRLAKAQGAQVN